MKSTFDWEKRIDIWDDNYIGPCVEVKLGINNRIVVAVFDNSLFDKPANKDCWANLYINDKSSEEFKHEAHLLRSRYFKDIKSAKKAVDLILEKLNFKLLPKHFKSLL